MHKQTQGQGLIKCSVSSDRRLGMEGKLWEQFKNYAVGEKRHIIILANYVNFFCVIYFSMGPRMPFMLLRIHLDVLCMYSGSVAVS